MINRSGTTSLSILQRNSAIESQGGSNCPLSYPKKDLDVQISALSISETAYEVVRKVSETDTSFADLNGAPSLSSGDWQPHLVVPQRVNGKGVTYVMVKVLANVSVFAGADGNNYKLDKGESVLLPEKNAKVLWQRKRAVLIADDIHTRLE